MSPGDPKELIPQGPSRIRTVTRLPIVIVLLLVVVVGGTIYLKSGKKPVPSAVQKTSDTVRNSLTEKGEPDYLNVGRFPKAPGPLPPNVPDLSGGTEGNGPGRKRDRKPAKKAATGLVVPTVPTNVLSAPSGPSTGGGLFVGSVDGGLGSSSSPLASPSRPFHAAQPVRPGNLPSAGSPGPGAGKPTAYEQTNMQNEKDRFLSSARSGKSSDILPNPVRDPLSPFELQAGSVIHGALVTGINSDLPGEVTAQVTGNVYDSIDERFLLIPQGSKLVGKYDSKVSVGQTRVLMAWERIIFPDGRSIDLSGMEGVDLEGYAGFHDIVDNHYLKIFGNAILMSLVMAGAQMSQPGGGYGLGGMNSFSNPSMGQAAIGSVGQNMSMTMEQYLGNTMNIQPTLKIRPGYRFDITVTKDMVFPGPYLVKGD